MEIPGDKAEKLNLPNHQPIETIAIEDIDVDLSSKQNVFSQPIPKNIKSKGTNPIKRLNTYDNDFLPQEDVSNQIQKSNNIFKHSDFSQFSNHLMAAFKGLITNTPVINYFIMKDRQSKLKQTLNKLNSINSDVDELINLSVPFGEKTDKYKMLCENLVKANQIHAQIRREIQE